ncbi:MAG: DUF1080 domain-containing protein [Verrucomicrobia bacterium]|nr:DUF1080 domain-containing protein [Verrucomicrobiota bacterium]MDA1068432.1 DUF1080 domain-containing protein [Verrucomicrobiota bacterium]
MNFSIRIFSLVCLLAVTIQAAHNRTLIFSDDFEGRIEIGDSYVTTLAGTDAWVIKDGVLIGKQTNPGHGAVIRKELPFGDLDMEIDFRFSGGSRFNWVIDDKNEKSVHAGHICRLSISPNSLKISDDKTGGMNLEVRAQRQDEHLSEKKKQSLEDLLQKTSSSAKLALEKGQWYRLRVRIQGDLMEAYIDSKLVANLRSPGIAHPTKTKFGPTVNDATIDFDNLQVFEAAQ